jgi:hypothetical protein
MHACELLATLQALQGCDLAIQESQAIAATLVFRMVVERGYPRGTRI